MIVLMPDLSYDRLMIRNKVESTNIPDLTDLRTGSILIYSWERLMPP